MKLAKNYAKVFNLTEDVTKKNTVTGIISTVEGKTLEGERIYNSWNCKFVGDAYEKACSLNEKDLIEITEGKIKNNYNKETKKLYVMVVIFNFNIKNNTNNKKGDNVCF